MKAKFIICLLVFFVMACKKETTRKPGQTAQKSQLTQLISDAGELRLEYDNDGQIKRITSTRPGSTDKTYTFKHREGRYEEITRDTARFSYYFANNKLSLIEVRNQTNEVLTKYDFLYNSSQLAEQIKYIRNAQTSRFDPQFKIKYTFSSAGNVAKTEMFSYILGTWAPGEIVFYEYDQKINSSAHVEAQLFLPVNFFRVNNPVKETFTSFWGDTVKTVSHTYSYNEENQPLTRHTTTVQGSHLPVTTITNYTYSK